MMNEVALGFVIDRRQDSSDDGRSKSHGQAAPRLDLYSWAMGVDRMMAAGSWAGQEKYLMVT